MNSILKSVSQTIKRELEKPYVWGKLLPKVGFTLSIAIIIMSVAWGIAQAILG